MNHAAIMARIQEILREAFQDPDLEISPATTAEDIPEWDSMRHISIIVAAESAFRIRFHTTELEGLKNVGALADLVERRLSKAAV